MGKLQSARYEPRSIQTSTFDEGEYSASIGWSLALLVNAVPQQPKDATQKPTASQAFYGRVGIDPFAELLLYVVQEKPCPMLFGSFFKAHCLGSLSQRHNPLAVWFNLFKGKGLPRNDTPHDRGPICVTKLQ